MRTSDNFVIEFTAALHQEHKLITAAVAVYFKNDYTDKHFGSIRFYQPRATTIQAHGRRKNRATFTYDQTVEDLSFQDDAQHSKRKNCF